MPAPLKKKTVRGGREKQLRENDSITGEKTEADDWWLRKKGILKFQRGWGLPRGPLQFPAKKKGAARTGRPQVWRQEEKGPVRFVKKITKPRCITKPQEKRRG